MIIAASEKVPLEKCPALVLNADFRPLSYYPLSLWCWQDAVKSVFLDRVSIVSNYKRKIRSPSFEMSLPSVIALKNFIKPSEHPSFTRFNVFLRDKFSCQYCGDKKDLTFDHLLPKSRGGVTDWENVITACSVCNVRKGGRNLMFSSMPINGNFNASRPQILGQLNSTAAIQMLMLQMMMSITDAQSTSVLAKEALSPCKRGTTL